MFEEDRQLLDNIKTEAVYLEGQLTRFKDSEDKLLAVATTAYARLEQQAHSKSDPELKQLNRQLRQVLAGREADKEN